MRLVKEARLFFQEGGSDKVYEIGLYEVGPGSCVVNFRYGRRGAALKEGSKTTSPVTQAAAEQVFDALVAEKTRKGYQPGTPGDAPAPGPVRRAPEPPADPGARARAIAARLQPPPAAAHGETVAPVAPPPEAPLGGALGRIVRLFVPAATPPPAAPGRPTAAAAARPKRPWPFARVAWRAGELRVEAALPALLDRLGQGPALDDYAVAAALGRLGDPAAIPALAQLYKAPRTRPLVRRIAREALMKLSSPALLAEFRADQAEGLPEAARAALAADDADALAAALAGHLQGDDPQRLTVVETLYVLDTPAARAVLQAFIRDAKLAPPAFQQLRRLWKLAEYRGDGAIFGAVVRRIETTRAGYRKPAGWGWVQVPDGRGGTDYLDGEGLAKELARPRPRIAYGSATRAYLRRRAARVLRRLGQAGDAAGYVALATGLLLAMTDADAQAPREGQPPPGRGRRRATPPRYDAWAPYSAFNLVLYGESPRYVLPPRRLVWRCRPPYEPGQPAPDMREEAFPALWDAQPAALLQLLRGSRCAPVQAFAAKALAPQVAFLDALPAEALADLVGSPYPTTAALGVLVARRAHGASAPEPLLAALLLGPDAEGRALARAWLAARGTPGPQLVGRAALSPYADVREAAAGWLVVMAADAVRAAIAHALAAMLATTDPADGPRIEGAGAMLSRIAAAQLAGLGPAVLRDMIAHPLPEVRALGAAWLLAHETPAGELAVGLVAAMLDSPDDVVRRAGATLYGRLPAETALLRVEWLADLAAHRSAAVREGIRPALGRLAAESPAFAERLAGQLVGRLAAAEQLEVAEHLAGLLAADHGAFLDALPGQALVALLHAPSPAAHRLAAPRFAARPALATELDPLDLAQLASHEDLAVREAAGAMLVAGSAGWLGDPAGFRRAIAWLDATWPDAEAAAFAFFRGLPLEAWTADALIAVADSPRPAVQALGRDLLTRAWRSEDAPRYMRALAEHPGPAMLDFASTLVIRHAAGDPAELARLAPYFTTVLCQVNRGRVAKDRVLAFLAAEALGSEAAARVAAGLLTRHAPTIVRRDRDRIVEALLAIHAAWPGVATPLTVHAPPLREGRP